MACASKQPCAWEDAGPRLSGCWGQSVVRPSRVVRTLLCIALLGQRDCRGGGWFKQALTSARQSDRRSKSPFPRGPARAGCQLGRGDSAGCPLWSVRTGAEQGDKPGGRVRMQRDARLFPSCKAKDPQLMWACSRSSDACAGESNLGPWGSVPDEASPNLTSRTSSTRPRREKVISGHTTGLFTRPPGRCRRTWFRGRGRTVGDAEN